MINKYGLYDFTMSDLSNSPSRMFTGGPLGMDRTCVPNRMVVLDLSVEEVIDDDRLVSWNTTQNVEVIFGPDPTSSGREHVVQILVPALYDIGKHFKGRHIPIPKSQHSFTDKAFGFNSVPMKGLEWTYVVQEVDVHRHLYKQLYIGFEPIRLALLHNIGLFPFYEDDACVPTPLKLMFDSACALFMGMADMIAVNAIRRKCEDEAARSLDSRHALFEKGRIARNIREGNVENAILESSNSWTEWGKHYLPQSFLAPVESEKPKKKGKKNASTKRRKPGVGKSSGQDGRRDTKAGAGRSKKQIGKEKGTKLGKQKSGGKKKGVSNMPGRVSDLKQKKGKK